MSPPTDTIARKWRKLKKRCSFSAGDRTERLVRSKSFTEPEMINSDKGQMMYTSQEQGRYEEREDRLQQDNASRRPQSDKDKYLTVGSKDINKFQGLRDRISQWNSELKKRRSSTENLNVQTKLESSSPSSLVLAYNNHNNYSQMNQTEDSNSMFVVASPKQGYVKSAVVISSNAKDTCVTTGLTSNTTTKTSSNTTSSNSTLMRQQRISPRNSTPVKNGGKDGGCGEMQQHSPLADSLAWSSPSPSPPASEDSGDFNQRNETSSHSYSHCSSNNIMFMDQDSGYDGFCPEKSIYSTGSSETSSLLSSDGHEHHNSSHNSNGSNGVTTSSTQYPSSEYTFPRARGRPRPSPIYEKHSEYGNREALRDNSSGNNPTVTSVGGNGNSINHYGTVNSSPRAKIAQATVVNLVKSSARRQESPPCTPPPPLPPRPALHPVSANSLPPIPSSLTKPRQITHGAVSLPRKKFEFAERARRRGSYHDDHLAAANSGNSGSNSASVEEKRGAELRIGSDMILEPISKVSLNRNNLGIIP